MRAHALALVFAVSCGGEPVPRTPSVEPESTESVTSPAPARYSASDHDGAEPESPAPEQHARSKKPREHAGVEVIAEVGGLDDERVRHIFEEAGGDLESCWRRGSSRIEFLGGSFAVLLKVGGEGRVVHAHAEKSSLGDRETERCMLKALGDRAWPRPVGGTFGLARGSIAFDPASNVRRPAAWKPDRVADTLAELRPRLSACREGVHGKFTATMYVEKKLVEPPSPPADASELADAGLVDAGPVEIGWALGVGMTPPDEAGEAKVDCLVRVLAEARWPSPGDRPAKVTFRF